MKYATQVVAGINYFIKVNRYPLPNEVEMRPHTLFKFDSNHSRYFYIVSYVILATCRVWFGRQRALFTSM